MNERAEKMQALRPHIVVEPSFAHEVDAFHHQVLRPILKWQNELLLTAFADWTREYKQDLAHISREKTLDMIEHAFKTHNRLRATLFGLISGLFTLSEYQFYLQNRRELNRRITSMAIKRVQDQVEALDRYRLSSNVL